MVGRHSQKFEIAASISSSWLKGWRWTENIRELGEDWASRRCGLSCTRSALAFLSVGFD